MRPTCLKRSVAIHRITIGLFKRHTVMVVSGILTKANQNLNRQFASETGILLDPVYTGKMMRGVYALISENVIKPVESVLCIHTGGLTGLLSEKWLNS